jgi:hypothetical protein
MELIRVHLRDSRLNLFVYICAHQRKSAAKSKSPTGAGLM